MNQRIKVMKEYVVRHDNIADLGIGKGYYYCDMDIKNVVGIDLNGSNLRKLANHSPHVKTFLRDIRDTGLPDKAYDLVVISQVIEHFKDYEPVIKEAKRICKDDGYFFIGTPTIAYHKLHYHPVWTAENVRNLAAKFGTIIEMKKFEDWWLLYIKNAE